MKLSGLTRPGRAGWVGLLSFGYGSLVFLSIWIEELRPLASISWLIVGVWSSFLLASLLRAQSGQGREVTHGVDRSGVAEGPVSGERRPTFSFLHGYGVGSLLVGLLEVTDAVAMLTGTMILLNYGVALLELVWVPVSVAATVASVRRHSRWWWLPLSYVLYNVGGWAIGAWLAATGRIGEDIFALPLWVIIGGLAFGLYFALASYVVFWRRSADFM